MMPRPVFLSLRWSRRHREIDPVPVAGRLARGSEDSGHRLLPTPAGRRSARNCASSPLRPRTPHRGHDRGDAVHGVARQLVEEVIRPALERGEVVVSDRFTLANVVYQGHAGGLKPEDLWTIGMIVTGGLEPELTLVFDLPARGRTGRRNRDADRMEERDTSSSSRVPHRLQLRGRDVSGEIPAHRRHAGGRHRAACCPPRGGPAPQREWVERRHRGIETSCPGIAFADRTPPGKSFQSAFARGRLGHSYLLVGPEGVGKHLFARELAKAFLCEKPPAPFTACDHCPGCAQVEAGTHPDLHSLRTPPDKHELPVDAMREFWRSCRASRHAADAWLALSRMRTTSTPNPRTAS